MKKKFGIREVVAVGIGTAFFVALTSVQVPLVVIPNTDLQPRMAVMAFFAAVFGPIVGGIIGLLGHVLGDAIFWGSVWWSWVIPDGLVGAIIGIFAKQYAVKDGGFTKKSSIAIFNGVQIAANAIAWIAVAPALDILIYAEPVNKVFTQGSFAFLGNIIIISILGTLIIAGYSKIAEKSNNLSVEE